MCRRTCECWGCSVLADLMSAKIDRYGALSLRDAVSRERSRLSDVGTLVVRGSAEHERVWIDSDGFVTLHDEAGNARVWFRPNGLLLLGDARDSWRIGRFGIGHGRLRLDRYGTMLFSPESQHDCVIMIGPDGAVTMRDKRGIVARAF